MDAFGTMDEPFANAQVVLITGAAGGLGQALVRTFCAANWRVAAGQNRHTIFTETDELLPVSVDVTNRSQIDQAIQTTLSRWGRIDALINNAGMTADAPTMKMRNADWQRVMDVNLKGAFLCSQAVIRTMFKQREGHIVNISSFAAKNGHVGQANYVAAKAGLVGLTQSLAKETGSHNVRVNAIFPGVLDTPMTADLTGEQRDRLDSTNVLGRSTNVEEVSQFIRNLTDMNHVSGQIFQLDSRIGKWT